jgi:hypothetical protein
MERAMERSNEKPTEMRELSDRELDFVTGGKFYKVMTVFVDGRQTWTVSTT